ncbi:MAG: hypothetical protein WCC11_00290 [Gammaproteobacteria bacterium]
MLNIQGFSDKLSGMPTDGWASLSSCSCNKKTPEGTFLRSPLRAIHLRVIGLARILAFDGKDDHPGYSFEKAHWAFVTGVGPLKKVQAPGSRIRPFRADAVTGDLYKSCNCLRKETANSILSEGTPYGAGSNWQHFRPLVWDKDRRDSSRFYRRRENGRKALDSGLRRNDGLKV